MHDNPHKLQYKCLSPSFQFPSVGFLTRQLNWCSWFNFFFTASKFEICNLNSQSHVKPPKIFTLLWELLPEVLELQSHLYIAHCILKSVKYIQRFLYLVLKFTIYCRAILQHVGYCGVSNFRFSPRYTWYYTRNDILFRFKEIKNVSFRCSGEWPTLHKHSYNILV